MKPKIKRPTIFDLERFTGFSRGTISRAFNESSEINPKTREIIMKGAAEIGYSPHPGARKMKLGRTQRWGLLLPHLQNPYYPELAECLDREARLRKTAVMLGLSHYDTTLEADIVRHWAAGETDGMVIDRANSDFNGELFEQLRARGLPLVFLHDRPSDDYDLVVSDSGGCFDRATRHLLALGHRRIAYFGQNIATARMTTAFTKYQSILDSMNLFDEDLVYLGDYESKSTVAALEHWLGLASPPTAVVCFSDIYACGIIHAARVSGLSVPRDLSVVGRDDIAEAARLGLTTIRNDRAAIAREAFVLLERRLKNPDARSERRATPCELIMRDSMAAPRGTA